MSELLGEWTFSERDIKLHEFAARYHTACEAYDRTVCTGPIGEDGILPATSNELGLINRFAIRTRESLMQEAVRDGFSRGEIAHVISHWRG